MDYLAVAHYAPELENGSVIGTSFEHFRTCDLSETTRVKYAAYRPDIPRLESELTSQVEIYALGQTDLGPSYEFFFIYKHIVHDPQDPIPDDANKLRISGSCFEALATRLMIPPAFVFALSRHYLPNGRGSRKLRLSNKSTVFDFWYFLPVRVQVESATLQAGVGPGDSQWPGQMNPFHKLHLPAVRLNILRSCVGIFSRVDPKARKVTFIAFDFMHGHWPNVALEPQQRIDEVMQQREDTHNGYGHSYFIDLVYLSSAARWWTNALNSINEQLISYELNLQTTHGNDHATPEAALTDINKALHSIAAHLHRYLSELKSLQSIAIDLLSQHEYIHEGQDCNSDKDNFEHTSRSYNQVLSQIEGAHDFTQELEKKTQNILNLLFNRIQINSDRLLVENGKAMQAILSAMQEDANLGRKMAKASHALAEEMKRDSVAMRTIAIVTMFFLPGATFAALLSTPFFSGNEWFADMSKFWIWVVLTVPSTCACFLFYRMWNKTAHSSVNDEISLNSNISP